MSYAQEDPMICVESGPARRITDISKLGVKPFLKKGKRKVSIEVLKKRAKKMNCDFGKEDLEYLMAHINEIPEKLRKFCLVFPCVAFKNSRGDRYYPWLCWMDSNEWVLIYDGSDYWYSNARGRFLSIGK